MATGGKRQEPMCSNDHLSDAASASKQLRLDDAIKAMENIDMNEPSDPKADESFLKELYEKRSFVRDERRIVLIGKTGSGKSAAGNTLLGRKCFESGISGSSITRTCESKMADRFGRNIQIVDTPGLFDTRESNDDVVNEIKRCVLMTSPGIHALILILRVGRFTDEDKRTVEYIRELFGEGLNRYMIVVFTSKDVLEVENTTVQEYTSTATPALKQLLTECNNRFLTVNNRSQTSERETFAEHLLDMVDDMVELNGGKCYTTAMFRRAEDIMKRIEEEEIRKLEEEKVKEREEVEKSVKHKYDLLVKEQDDNLRELRKELEEIQKRVTVDREKHEEVLAGLERELEIAEKERLGVENEKKKWKEEMEKKKEEKNRAMMLTMMKMEEEKTRRVEELELRMEQIEEERQRREGEMRRRHAELDQRDEEEKLRLRRIEEEREKYLEELKEEEKKMLEMYSENIQNRARERARLKMQRGAGCAIM